jgi:PAS domain S-box-containing protein
MATFKGVISENQFTYLNILPLSVLVSNPNDGKIVFTNREFEEAFGYDGKKLKGSQLSCLFQNESDLALFTKTFKETGKVSNYIFLGKREDSSLRWILLSTESVQAEDGSQLLVSTLVDITDQKNEEVLIHEREKLYQTVFNSSPVMFWVKDTNNRTLQINQAAASFEGVNPNDVAGKSCYDIYPLEQAEAFYQDDLEVINSGKPKLGIIEKHTAVGSGDNMWVETGKVPIRNPEGEITGVMAFAIDITNSKQAEEALKTSEARFRTLFEASTDANLILENNVFVDCNHATVEMLRAGSKEEVLSMHLAQLSPEHQPNGELSAQKAEEMIQIALKQGSSRFEWIHRRSDGEDFPVEVLLTPIPLGGRTVIHTVWRDISDRKRLEAEIQESLQKRGEQVELTTQVVQEIATARDISTIFEQVVTLVKERFNYYHAQIFRYSPTADAMQLVAGYGETGAKMLKVGHKLQVGQGVVGTAAATGKATLASDVTQDKDWRPNPYLPNTQGELAVPIKFQDEVLGILDVQSGTAGFLSQDDVLLLENLAGQIAIAIENARLRDEMEIRLEEIESLYHSISKTQGSTSDDNIALSFKPGQGAVEQNIDQWLEEIERSILQKSTYIERSPNGQDASLAIVPVNMRGEIIGALGIQPSDLQELSQEDLEMLEAVSDQVAQALENARLFRQTKSRSEELASLNEIISAASQTLDMNTILETVMNKVLEISGFDGGLITIFNETRGKLERGVRIGLPGTTPEDPAEGLDGSLCHHVYKSGKGLAIQDMSTQTPEGINVTKEVEAGFHGYLGIPVLSKGTVLGTLCVFRYKNEPIAKNTVDLINTIGGQLGFTVENSRLFEESRKFRLGLERSADAVFMTDLAGTIVYANPSFEKIYGFPLNEVIGKTPRILKSGIIPQERYKHFWDSLLDKGTVSGEIVNKKKDGKLIPIEGTNSPILDEAGNILGFLAIHSDITQRKENEEALKRRNEYLAASSEIGRLVTSTLDLEAIFTRSVNLVVERFGFYHASVFIIDEAGLNAVLQESTGTTGQKLKERKHALPVGSNSTVGKAAATGEVVVINDTTLDLLHKPNPLLPETKAETAIPLRVGSRTIGVLDIQSTEVDAFTEDDIAILQLLADQIAVGIDNARSYNLAQLAVEEMREVDRLKSQFLANMSHELRTPLNSIIGFARVILKGIDGPITELQQQDLTAIFNSGQHLLGLINDILDLSRIEAGKMELTFDEVNISDLIHSVMSTAVGLVKDKPIQLKPDIAEDLPLVRADAMRIRQVLINFLSNASKFTDEGEIVVRARFEKTAHSPAAVRIEVIDSGPGISEEDQIKLFQPFSQVDASLTRKVGGSGLGLSICHHLIQMHNGQIGLESAVGKGSIFYFSIPIVEKSKIEGQGNDRIILSIDDDPQIISLYERYLVPKGFQVIGVSDPAKAKERAKQVKPYAITLDIMMPGYDGWQVLTDLKSSEETRDIPVIVCSIVEDEEKGFSLGAADYLVKPILEEDLLTSLDRLNGDGSIREVLVIDDDPNDLRLFGKMLSEQGKYKAILAEGGLAGWNSIKLKPPHAVVLDLFMPEMDGFTILERLRKDEKLRNLPVIVITGADLTTEQQKQLEGLGQRLLQKSSLKERELISTIENVLQRVKAI